MILSNFRRTRTVPHRTIFIIKLEYGAYTLTDFFFGFRFGIGEYTETETGTEKPNFLGIYRNRNRNTDFF